MGQVRFSVAVSLDGYMAGPEQSLDDPLGKGGMQLHQWAFKARRGEEPVSAAILDETTENVGAYILGRNMFGGGRGDWGDGSWKGWWGDDRRTTHPSSSSRTTRASRCRWRAVRPSTSSPTGIESALDRARAAAGDRDIVLGGGASLIQQYLRAGLVDELQLNVAPVLLGSGERPLDNLAGAGLELEPERVVDAPGVTHLKYRVVRT